MIGTYFAVMGGELTVKEKIFMAFVQKNSNMSINILNKPWKYVYTYLLGNTCASVPAQLLLEASGNLQLNLPSIGLSIVWHDI